MFKRISQCLKIFKDKNTWGTRLWTAWENASLSIFVGKQPRLVKRLSRVMKRGNTGVRVRWDTTRKETNRRSGKENGRSNASCVSARQDAPAKGSRWDISLRKWNSMRMDGRTICRTSELERHMAWVPPRFYITITPIGSIVFI